MKFFYLLFNIFLLSQASPYLEYQINDNTYVEFLTQYEGKTAENLASGGPFLEYSTAYDIRYIINTYDQQYRCEYSCAHNASCLGVYLYNNNASCNTLSNLGTYEQTDHASYSKHKMVMYDNPVSRFSITGICMTSNRYIENQTVYLDLNDNGVFDIGEPSTQTNRRGRFVFNNMDEGVYIVRQLPYNDCNLVYPGAHGVNDANEVQTGFADSVISYYHSKYYLPMGGVVLPDKSYATYNNVSFENIIGNYHRTYMSFNNNDSIVLGFLDDIIVNTGGDDLFFELVGNESTDTEGHVYVSSRGNDYYYIGVVNTSQTSLDLQNFSSTVSRVKINFFGNDGDYPLNISGVRGNINITYSPEYGTAVLVPSLYNNVFFVNDCNYFFRCSTYCSWMTGSTTDYNSCLSGCTLFSNTQNCNCTGGCFEGCDYAMRKYVFPDYIVYNNAEAEVSSRYVSSNCNHCLDNQLEACDNDDNCDGFTVRSNGEYSLSSDHVFYYVNNSNFFVKNSFSGANNLTYEYYTTPTSTLTSTVSSTLTSTVSSTLTSTGSSTLTSTGSSTLTSTGSSTLTSTGSSTLTKTESSTLTSTVSSTPTTTIFLNVEQPSLILEPGVIAVIVISCLVALIALYGMHKHYKSEQNTKVTYNSYDNAMFNPEKENTPTYDNGMYVNDDTHPTVTNSSYYDVDEKDDFEEPNVNENYIDVETNE